MQRMSSLEKPYSLSLSVQRLMNSNIDSDNEISTSSNRSSSKNPSRQKVVRHSSSQESSWQRELFERRIPQRHTHLAQVYANKISRRSTIIWTHSHWERPHRRTHLAVSHLYKGHQKSSNKQPCTTGLSSKPDKHLLRRKWTWRNTHLARVVRKNHVGRVI